MTFTEQQVEWIVMEVIRRLETLPGVAGDELSSSPVSEDLAIADKVVTLRSIEGRLVGVKRLVVRPRAVITPAVKDELKLRKVELVVRPN
jgi:hypothetical protein